MIPLPFAHPPGGRWTYVLLKGLVERGHRVTMFVPCLTQEQQNMARDLFPVPAFDVRTYAIQEFKRTWLFANKWNTLRKPYSYMFSRELQHDLAETLEEPWDVLHLEDIWTGWLGLPYDRRKTVLNFHNLYRIDDGERYEKNWRAKWIRVTRHRTEARLARAYPTLITLTERLALELRKLAPRSCVHVCPLGIDVSLYPFSPLDRRPNRPVVSIIGSMSWHSSLSAAKRLLTRLWPAIKTQVPAARCQIVGWGARAALQDYLTVPDVEIVENVPDIRPYFEQTGVMIYAPGRGSGMKVKVLEAFAYGVPVVTTSEGIEGIPAVDGVHAGVCEHDAGLIERTVHLLQDGQRRERQRQAARVLLESHCSPKATLDIVERVYSSCQV